MNGNGASRGAHLLVLASTALIAGPSLPASSRPLIGSAPAIMRSLVPAIVSEFDPGGSKIVIPPPFGPPQGRMNLGLESFLTGQRSFAFSSRDVSEQDLTSFRAHHRGLAPLLVPVAQGAWNRFGYADAVVIIVNRANPIRSLTFSQIDAIFSRSRLRGAARVQRWSDLSSDLGHLGNREVDVAGSDAWTGEESARALTVRRRILSVDGKAGSWRRDAPSGAEADVVATVGADLNAVGFTGMGHLSPQVRVVPIGPDGQIAISPTDTTARNGSYPLLRTIDLLVSPSAPKQTLCHFARFLLGSRGQAIIARQGDFAPLPSRVRRKAIGYLRSGLCRPGR